MFNEGEILTNVDKLGFPGYSANGGGKKKNIKKKDENESTEDPVISNFLKSGMYVPSYLSAAALEDEFALESSVPTENITITILPIESCNKVIDENVYKELVDQAHEEIAQPQTHASAKEMAKKRTTKRRINKVKMNKRKTKKRV